MTSIGIFDSGIGGLTVLRALKEVLPGEAFVYLGDTARLPYGSKSPETIRRYLIQNVAFLKTQGVKAIVVACNSASTALCEEDIDGMRIYGVIRPGARRAIELTRSGHVGILGTRATVISGAYVKALLALNPNLKTLQQACPLLVPLVEEGWDDDPVTRQVMERYLEEPLKAGVDTLILGCTHYPVLKHIVADIAGANIHLVDSARVMAEWVRADIESGALHRHSGPVTTKVMTTDTSEAFRWVGNRILAPFHVDDWLLADLK